MWGYRKHTNWLHPRFVIYELAVILILLVVINWFTKTIRVNEQFVATILVGVVGGLIAIEAVYIQVKNNLKLKMEVKAISDITEAMYEFQQAAAATVTFTTDFVIPNTNPSVGYWNMRASDRHLEFLKIMQQIMEANHIYAAIEKNEIAIIHLEQYYLFVNLKIDEFHDLANTLLSNYLHETSKWELSQDEYKAANDKLKEIRDAWSDLAAYFIDLRKLFQNELLSEIFSRKLLKRKPLPGFGTTLDRSATIENVRRMVDERDKRIGLRQE